MVKDFYRVEFVEEEDPDEPFLEGVTDLRRKLIEIYPYGGEHLDITLGHETAHTMGKKHSSLRDTPSEALRHVYLEEVDSEIQSVLWAREYGTLTKSDLRHAESHIGKLLASWIKGGLPKGEFLDYLRNSEVSDSSIRRINSLGSKYYRISDYWSDPSAYED